MERRRNMLAMRIYRCPGIKEDLNSGRPSAKSCEVQGRFSIPGVDERHVGTSFDESTHDIYVPTACRTSEGRVHWRGDAVWVCARGKQDTHHTDVGRAHRKFEGSRFVVTLGVPIQRVYLTPHREGRFDHRRRRR